jgi:hypothetical protein
MATQRGRAYLVKDHPLYDVWRGMRDRCTRPDHISWPNYGGRGISLHPEWADAYRGARRFLDWVEANLGPRPEGHTLDRIETSGDYVPGNLQWSPWAEQNTNKRTAIQAECDGEPMSLHAALMHVGLNASQATYAVVRVRKGMSVDEATGIYPHVNPSRIKITSIPPKRVWRLNN